MENSIMKKQPEVQFLIILIIFQQFAQLRKTQTQATDIISIVLRICLGNLHIGSTNCEQCVGKLYCLMWEQGNWHLFSRDEASFTMFFDVSTSFFYSTVKVSIITVMPKNSQNLCFFYNKLERRYIAA